MGAIMTVTSHDIAISIMSRAHGLADGLELYNRSGVRKDSLVESLEAVLDALNDDWRIFLRKRGEEAARDRP
jgi:hypothetical protein